MMKVKLVRAKQGKRMVLRRRLRKRTKAARGLRSFEKILMKRVKR